MSTHEVEGPPRGQWESSKTRRCTVEESQCGWRMRVRKARGEESAIFKMVRESQGPRPGHALLEYLSGRMTDPSSAPSLTSVAYLLIHC